MSEYDKWDEVEDPDEPEIKQTIKQALAPKEKCDLPIPARFLKTTKGLFYEHRHHTTVDEKAPYTLRNMDFTDNAGHLYKSMYMIYMGCDSEYEAAIKLLGNYAHWLKLKATTWFAPHLEAWNEELTLREEALARSKLVTLTEAGNVTAARTLLGNKKNPVGKPKKSAARKDYVTVDDIDSMLRRTEGASQQKH